MSSEYDLNLTEEESTKKTKSNPLHIIPRKLRIILSIVIITIVIISLLNAFKPEARKRPIPETVVRVEVIQAARSSYPIIVNANGTVEAETRGNLVAQIRGEIVAVSDKFRTGGSFKKGDLLIQLDQRDYQAELSQAQAQLSQAEAVYRQEQANSKQAELDWQRLGNTTPAPDLVLRKPQLTAAKAQYDSAKAAFDTAKLNLSRTAIKAPYDGRIIERQAVLGQYVGIGTPIAEVFATEGVEVRLPISQEEFSQLGLDNFQNNGGAAYKVSITSDVGNQTYQWDATLSRTDSTFDINTRQIDIIADVIDPFGKVSGQPALKIGQFVSARIEGRAIDNVFVIPNKSIREGSYVYAVRDGKLTKLGINIIWQDDQNALVNEGLELNEQVVTTSLNSTLAGASAKLANNEEGAQQSPSESNSTVEKNGQSNGNTSASESQNNNTNANVSNVPDEQLNTPASSNSSNQVDTESLEQKATSGVSNSVLTSAVNPATAEETLSTVEPKSAANNNAPEE